MTYVILVTIIVYIGMIFFSKYRTPIAFMGSGLLLILGILTGSYDVNAAFAKFPSEIVILIIVLSLFTKIFEDFGLIDYIGHTFIKSYNEKKAVLLTMIIVVVYACSLFMNNLTVVLLFTYMLLYIAVEYRLPIIPLFVSVVIGSNIGGAPLPWSDTPAVVITLYSDFGLLDFLNKMFIPCAIFTFLLCVYTYIWCKRSGGKCDRYLPFREKPDIDWKKVIPMIILFALYIVSVSAGPFYNISIAYVSLVFGSIGLIMHKESPIDTLNNLSILDSLCFIIALFIIGGVLECTGVLSQIAQYIISLTNQNGYLIMLAILFMAFTIATFLSAGPAAATLIPICLNLSPLVENKLIFAALALGILAGSSMLPWSATGGPVLFGEVNRFLSEVKVGEENERRIRELYNLKSYIAFSIPFSLIILFTSAIYLLVYLRIVS